MNGFAKLRAAVLAIAAASVLMLPSEGALAQTVTAQPQFANPGAVLDLGPGPMEIRAMSGNGQLFTGLGSGAGGNNSVSGTGITLTGTPDIPPRVGSVIQGAGITGGTTVAAYNGTTGVTLSAAMSVANGTALTWGAACSSMPSTTPKLHIQPGQTGGDIPLYTVAEVCLSATNSPGLQFLQFAIGAH